MPIYEYRCASCETAFEHLARTLSEPAPPCPKCGSANVAKEFSTFAAKSASKFNATCDACPSSGGACPSAGHACGAGCGCR